MIRFARRISDCNVQCVCTSGVFACVFTGVFVRFLYLFVCLCARACMSECACVHVRVYACVRVWVCVSVYVGICACARVHVRMRLLV